MTVSTLPRGKCAWRKLRVKALLFVWEHSSTYIHILCTVTCKSNPCLSKAAYIVDIICPQNKYSLHFTTSPNLYDFLLWNNKLARILVLLLFFTQWKWWPHLLKLSRFLTQISVWSPHKAIKWLQKTWNIAHESYGPLSWCFYCASLSILELEWSSYSLSLYGIKQHGHSAMYLILCSTENVIRGNKYGKFKWSLLRHAL